MLVKYKKPSASCLDFIIVMAQAQLVRHAVGNITFSDFSDFCVAVADPEECVFWCQRHQLLPESMACPKCTRDMHLVTRDGSHGAEGMVWRCPRKGCRKEVSLRSCTFFEGKF